MQVKVIQTQGKAALVEYQDAQGVHRVTLPAEKVNGEQVEYTDLQAGIPYGIAWEKIELTPVTVGQIAQAFRSAGIWTETDLHKNLPGAKRAIQEVNGLNLGFLLDAIRRIRES